MHTICVGMYVMRLDECLACEPSDEPVIMLNQVVLNFLYKNDIADDCKQQVPIPVLDFKIVYKYT